MKKPPQEPPKPSRPVPIKAYEDQVPAAVPDAHESNSESVWAMFQQSIINTEERVAVAAELAAAKAKDDAAAKTNAHADPPANAEVSESDFADTNFDATNFSDLRDDTNKNGTRDSTYDPTLPAPLKPEER